MLVTWEELRIVLHKGERHTLLYGPPGTGKTTTARQLGDGSVYSVTMTDDTSAPEMLGHFVPTAKGGFAWHDGPAVRAWREGGLLILNEIDHAVGGAEIALHAILDDFNVAMLTLSSGETVRPKVGFRVVATMNGTPDQLTPALLDRFAVRIAVDMPSPEMFALLPADVARVCYNVYKNGDISRYSFRQMLAFSELRGLVGAELAAKSVFADLWHDFLNVARVVVEA